MRVDLEILRELEGKNEEPKEKSATSASNAPQ